MGLSAENIAAARAALAAADPALAKADAVAAPFPWRERERGFAGLAKVMVGQQVSTASANAIWTRLEAGLGGAVTPAATLAASEEQLRGLGLSGQKARYIQAIAREAAVFDELPRLDDEAAVARLTAIKGVGRWTAEAYLLFGEGRSDFFPAGDLALQEAVRLLRGEAERPSEKALYEISLAWKPHRGVAALLLWSYYALARKRDGAP